VTEVKVVNLTKRFGEIVALDKVSFEIKDKEYLTVIGPSGCGKTTLLKCLAGIHSPTEGEIYFNRRLMNDVPIEERKIGYVFQEVALFPHMNVWDNITYGPRVKDLPSDMTVKIGQNFLKMIRLGIRSNSFPKDLSGGARQKTGLARALASSADLLLLDEPLGSLDVKSRTDLRYEIRDLVKDLGLTAIHITHDQEEAMSIGDRVVVLKAGRLLDVESPYELYSNPKTLFMSNFVGDANFLEGRVVKVLKNSSFVDSRGLLLESNDSSRAEGDRVVAMIRPEYVSVTNNDNTKEGIPAFVENFDFEGATIRYEVIIKNSRQFIVRLPYTSSIETFDVGEKVILNFTPKNTRLYSYPEVGLRRELALE